MIEVIKHNDSCDIVMMVLTNYEIIQLHSIAFEHVNYRCLFILGIKMMYHHYKSSKEEEINEIRGRLYGEEFDHASNRRNEPME